MDLTVEEFIDGLLTKEAAEKLTDTVKPEEIVLRLPKWFDEKKFNRGRDFYWSHSAMLSISMTMGLVTVLAIPSILRVMIGTNRSTTHYSAYKRYVSTFLHVVLWFEHDLKPGSRSWRSLELVRTRHLRAGLNGKLKGYGIVSQRDLALTLFALIGYSVLYPDKFGIYQLRRGDWDAYNYFWRVIGHMLGIEDRYNLCRNTVEETREVCRVLQLRVFTPCMNRVPEHYEHMARALLDGLNVLIDTNSDTIIFLCKCLSKVPGYICTEQDRIDLQKKIFDKLEANSIESGIDSRLLIEECAIELPETKPNLLYLQDYETVIASPPYRQLTRKSEFRLNLHMFLTKLYPSSIGRFLINLYFKYNLFIMKYFPFWGYLKYGLRDGHVNILKESPIQVAQPKLNSEYYEKD